MGNVTGISGVREVEAKDEAVRDSRIGKLAGRVCQVVKNHTFGLAAFFGGAAMMLHFQEKSARLKVGLVGLSLSLAMFSIASKFFGWTESQVSFDAEDESSLVTRETPDTGAAVTTAPSEASTVEASSVGAESETSVVAEETSEEAIDAAVTTAPSEDSTVEASSVGAEGETSVVAEETSEEAIDAAVTTAPSEDSDDAVAEEASKEEVGVATGTEGFFGKSFTILDEAG